MKWTSTLLMAGIVAACVSAVQAEEKAGPLASR